MSHNDGQLSAEFWAHAFGKAQSGNDDIVKIFKFTPKFYMDSEDKKMPQAGSTQLSKTEIDDITRMMVNFKYLQKTGYQI